MPLNGSATSSPPAQSRQATLTSEASLTCAPATSPDMINVISSPGSDTCGPTGSSLSESADLSRSLANRLRPRTDLLGSTLFNLIWKTRATPAGRLIYALRASGRRTSDSDCGSWPTPCSQQANGEPEAFLERKRRSIARGSRMGVSLTDLQMVAKLASWPTPDTMSGPHGPRGASTNPNHQSAKGLEAIARMSGWPMPTKGNADGSQMAKNASVTGRRPDGSKATVSLNQVASLASWATPAARDWCDGRASEATMEKNARSLNEQAVQLTVSGETPNGFPARTEKRGQLRPGHSRWLMGISPEWDACAPTATRSINKSRRSFIAASIEYLYELRGH